MPSATAILDRFLHHAEIIKITGKSYRLRNQNGPAAEAVAAEANPAKAPTGSAELAAESKPARAPTGKKE